MVDVKKSQRKQDNTNRKKLCILGIIYHPHLKCFSFNGYLSDAHTRPSSDH